MAKIPPTNRNTPSDEVKRNKAKTLEVGGPILSQIIPGVNKLSKMYEAKEYKTSRLISIKTPDASLKKVATNFNRILKG
jgi:hypothetical protein